MLGQSRWRRGWESDGVAEAAWGEAGSRASSVGSWTSRWRRERSQSCVRAMKQDVRESPLTLMRGLGVRFTFGCQASTAAANGPLYPTIQHLHHSCAPIATRLRLATAFLPARLTREAPLTRPRCHCCPAPSHLPVTQTGCAPAAWHCRISAQPIFKTLAASREARPGPRSVSTSIAPVTADVAAVCSAHVLADALSPGLCSVGMIDLP